METPRPAGEEDDAFALRLTWDDSDDEASELPAFAPRHRREEAQHRSASPTAPEPPSDRPSSSAADTMAPGIHDIVNRVELRQIGVVLGELRREVADLRSGVSALLEDRASLPSGPSMDDLRADVATLRDEVRRRLPEGGGAAVPELQPVLDEIGALRADMVALKRRIAVRASAAGDATGEQADQIAHLVAERLAGWLPKPAR